jgi:hypothetical protein
MSGAMNSEGQDRILERVRKMLRLANNAGATEGERDNAMRMAHATLAKYNLDLAAVESDGKSEGGAAEQRIEQGSQFPGFPWARQIAESIAELFFCAYLYAGKGSTTRHFFIGKHSNAVTASLVAEFVVRSVNREAGRFTRANRERVQGAFGISGERQRLFGIGGTERDFGWGAAVHIRKRVSELRTDARQAEESTPTNTAEPSPPGRSPGSMLVLASIYSEEESCNEDYIARRYPNLRSSGRRPRASLSDAFAAGRAFGTTVSLSPQLK